MRCPSRIVIVGGMLMKRSRTLVLDCDRPRSDALAICFRAGFVVAAVRRGLCRTGDDAECDRRAEDFEVVVVGLILQPGIADLIETVELVEIDGVAIGHDEAGGR